MALNEHQASKLDAAISAYSFPAVYFDFQAGAKVETVGMSAVEGALRAMLTSASVESVRDGLANVIYWGYAQVG
ncbi:MAG: hypothetical protein AB7Q29_13455 [Vicinamibacterales bacterium]